MVQKRALLVAIRSVLGSEYADLPKLGFAHRDAKELQSHLIEYFGYQTEDVVLMIDDSHHPKHLWPTHHKIMQQIDQLTHDIQEGCHIFFYYSGHGLEEECRGRAGMRADGQDEEIVSADGKPILDYILHDRLITPLEKVKDSKLFALFDCCHSETLLDLQRGRGMNNYSRIWNIGRDQLFRALSISIVAFLGMMKKYPRANDSSLANLRRRSTIMEGEPISGVHEIGELTAICLSACRDGQLAHDDCKRELTFTKCFMDVLVQNPNVSWTELRERLKELICEIRRRYESICWEQEPRICTNSSYTDLTRAVKLAL